MFLICKRAISFITFVIFQCTVCSHLALNDISVRGDQSEPASQSFAREPLDIYSLSVKYIKQLCAV